MNSPSEVADQVEMRMEMNQRLDMVEKENRGLRDQLHELLQGQRAIATKTELSEEIADLR